MIAIREAWQAGLLRKEHWPRNLLAGLIVGLVALPLAMAFAIASGMKPEAGLYTAIVAGALVTLFGGSRVQIAGPTGAFVVILAGVTQRYGVDGLQIATLLAGILLIVFGLLRVGAVLQFIPAPVIAGFTSGIAIIIWVGQWQHFFGLPPVTGEYFHQKLWALLQVLPQLQPTPTVLAMAALAVMMLTPRLLPTVPGPLVALVVATAVVKFAELPVATIGTTFGGIPSALPTLQFPQLSLDKIIELVRPAFAIALLGSIESLLSAVVADGMAGTRHDSNQELIGQGIANVVAPLFGGFAATGAIARTATSIRSGGSSPLAGLVHCATLALVILLLAPLARDIPLCVLAAILFIVAWNMAEARNFVRMVRRAPPPDVFVLLATFALTVFVDLIVAVNVGVVLAALLFMRRMSAVVELQPQSTQQIQQELERAGLRELPKSVMIYSINGPFFFAAVDNFERTLRQAHTRPAAVIFRMGGVPIVDITGLQALEAAVRQLQKRGTRVMMCELTPRVAMKLQRAEILSLLGTDNVHNQLSDALRVLAPVAAAAEPAPEPRGCNE
jgi:SulP family sulfate permease